jgi:hypothetical protein
VPLEPPNAPPNRRANVRADWPAEVPVVPHADSLVVAAAHKHVLLEIKLGGNFSVAKKKPESPCGALENSPLLLSLQLCMPGLARSSCRSQTCAPRLGKMRLVILQGLPALHEEEKTRDCTFTSEPSRCKEQVTKSQPSSASTVTIDGKHAFNTFWGVPTLV